MNTEQLTEEERIAQETLNRLSKKHENQTEEEKEQVVQEEFEESAEQLDEETQTSNEEMESAGGVEINADNLDEYLDSLDNELEDWLNSNEDDLETTEETNISETTQTPKEQERKQIKKQASAKASDETYGTPGAYRNEKGEVKTATRKTVDISEKAKNVIAKGSPEDLRNIITTDILQKFGYSVRSITIKSGILIIDNIQPNINISEELFEQYGSSHCISLMEHLQENELGPLFSWSMLKRKANANVTTINIDNDEYWYSWVSPDLFPPKYDNKNKRKLMFDLFPNLQTLMIAGKRYTVDTETETPELDRSQQVVNETYNDNIRRRREIFKANFEYKLHNGTSNLNRWTVNNLARYAKNRGDRGILRFGLGLASRGVLALAATAVNFVTQAVYAGFTPVDELETNKHIVEDYTADETPKPASKPRSKSKKED